MIFAVVSKAGLVDTDAPCSTVDLVVLAHSISNVFVDIPVIVTLQVTRRTLERPHIQVLHIMNMEPGCSLCHEIAIRTKIMCVVRRLRRRRLGICTRNDWKFKFEMKSSLKCYHSFNKIHPPVDIITLERIIIKIK